MISALKRWRQKDQRFQGHPQVLNTFSPSLGSRKCWAERKKEGRQKDRRTETERQRREGEGKREGKRRGKFIGDSQIKDAQLLECSCINRASPNGRATSGR